MSPALYCPQPTPHPPDYQPHLFDVTFSHHFQPLHLEKRRRAGQVCFLPLLWSGSNTRLWPSSYHQNHCHCFFFNYHKDHYIQDVATFSAPPSSSYCCSFCSSSWETSGFRDEINYVLKQFCSTYYCKTDLWRQQNILRPFFTKIYRIVFSCTCWEGSSQEGRQRRQWVLLRQRYGVQPSINNKGKVFYNKGMMYSTTFKR